MKKSKFLKQKKNTGEWGQAIFYGIMMIFIMVFAGPWPAYSAENSSRIKINLAEQEISVPMKSKGNLCNMYASSTTKKLVDRFIQLQYQLGAIARDFNKDHKLGNSYVRNTKLLQKNVSLKGLSAVLFEKLHYKSLELSIKLSEGDEAYQNQQAAQKNALIILLRTAVKGQPSLYGLQVAIQEMENYLLNVSPKRVKYRKQLTKVSQAAYFLYKKQQAKDFENLKRALIKRI